MSDPVNMVSHENLPSWEKIMKDPYFGHFFPMWINNAMENYQTIKAEFQAKDRCLTTHPRPMNRPCIVIGRGPSADKVGPILKKWQHPIFSTFSNATFPVAYGVEPSYISAFDSVLTMERLKHHKWDKSIMLTHPNIDPRMIKSWKWEKLYYRRMFPGLEFFELAFPLMYPFIRIGIQFTGSVVNNVISIASFLGYNPIFLIGCDLCWYNHDATSSQNWQFKPDGTLYVSDTQPFTGDPNTIFNINGKWTDERMLNFKEGLYHIWSSDNGNVIDCSGGILEEMPKADISEVIKNQGRGYNNLLPPREVKIGALRSYVEWERKFIEDKKALGYVSPDH